MSIFSRFLPAAPNNNPQGNNNDQESVEKMRKSVRTLNQQQLAKLLNQFERNRRQLSGEQLRIIEDHLNDLRGRSQDAAHQQLISLCDARLKILQERMANGGGENNQREPGLSNTSMGAMVGGGIGAAILSWLGFRSIRRNGIFGAARSATGTGWRGMLGLGRMTGRTGLYAASNPLQAAILGGLGLGLGAGVTKEIRDYMQLNRDSLVREIEGIARERNIEPQQAAHDVGHRIGDYIRSAGSSTVDTFIKGIVYVCQGTINPETGAIVLPHSTLRPHFWVAYQAGTRSRWASGKIWRNVQPWLGSGFQTTTQKMMSIADIAVGQSVDRAKRIDDVHKEIKFLEKKGDLAGAKKLENKLAKALNIEINKDTGTKLQLIAGEAEALHRKNITDFPKISESVRNDLQRIEDRIRTGKDIPTGTSVESWKRTELQKVQDKMDKHYSDLKDRKIDLGNQYAKTANDHAKARMDTAGGGVLDRTRNKMEKAGITVTGATKVGNFAVKAAIGWSLFPLMAETASATMNMAEGDVKQKNLRKKKEDGYALTENEERELKRLENQWKAVGWDAAQLGGGFLPVVGEAIDFYGAISGKDLNDRQLSTMSRVTMGVMGTLGVGSLVLAPLTGGISVIGFRAIRGGRAASKALNTAKGAEQGVKALEQSTKFIDTARKIGTLTTVQKTARAGRTAIQTTRSGMQIFSYGMLGYQMGAGAVDFLSHNRIGEMKERAAKFTESIGDTVADHIPGHRPPRTPSGEGPALQHPMSSGPVLSENPNQTMQ